MTRYEYYKSKLERNQERAAYHEERFEETGNQYHEEQASRLRDEEAKLTSKMKNARKKKEVKKDVDNMPTGMATPVV